MTTTLQSQLSDTFTLRKAFYAAAPEFPTDVLPIGYGALTGGSGGISYCPCIDTAANKHLIFDHAIVDAGHGNSPTFYTDRVPIAPTSWNAADTVGGRTAATVTFGASQVGKRVGYRGMGACDIAGAMITNPIAVLSHFLALVGTAVADIEATALANAQARAGTLAYLCAGILATDRSAGTTVSEILSCFGGCYFVNADGKLVVLIDDGRIPGLQGLACHVAAQYFERAEATLDRAEIVNQVAVEYCYNGYDITLQANYQAYDDGTITKSATSQSLHGPQGPGSTTGVLSFPWCRDLTSVRTVQGIIVSRLGFPRIKVRASLEHLLAAHVDPGDYVGWSWPRLYDGQGRPLKNQIGTVEQIELDCDQAVSTLFIRDTGAALSRAWPLDGSWALGGSKSFGAERDMWDYA